MLAAHQLTGAAVGLRGQLMRLQYEVFAGRPIDKPAGFQTARTSTGFNLAINY